jgi:predicted nucleic acid-binding protein
VRTCCELWKEKPDPNVRAWFFSSDWFLPVPVIAQIQEGAKASPSAARRIEISRKFDASLHAALVSLSP